MSVGFGFRKFSPFRWGRQTGLNLGSSFLCFLSFLYLAAEPDTRKSIHLSMDDGMWSEMEPFLENFGCVNSSDAVRGEALLIENRSFLDIKLPEMSWFGEGDFTLSFWIKIAADSGRIPWFTSGALGGSSALIVKRDSDQGFYVGFIEGRLLWSCSNVKDYEEPFKNIRIPREATANGLNDDRWHHLVFLREAHSYQVWLDGQLEFEMELEKGYNFANTSYLRIGAAEDGRQCFEGKLDELKLDPFAWTPLEISQRSAECCSE